MSSRAVRKALKRLEAQKEPKVEDPQQINGQDEESVEGELPPSNPFAMASLPVSRRSTNYGS